MIPKRIATIVINSLKGGVVPREGLEYIAVGRKLEIEALLHDINIIEDGGAAFKFIVGKYGSGKSFLLQTIRNNAIGKGFVVVDADLSPERRLVGAKGQGLATYKELIRNMSTKSNPDGGALNLILEKWIVSIQTQISKEEKISIDDPKMAEKVEVKIYETINELSDMVHGFDFATIIYKYWKARRNEDDEIKGYAVKWLRGEYSLKSEAKKELGISNIISDDDWYDYLKLFASLLIKSGYKGLLILIDELVNIYKLPNTITRQNNYEKILTIYNDILQGKAKNMGIIMSGTPQCIEDTRKGVFSYEALKSRLENGRFSSDGLQDYLAPVLKLSPLSQEEVFVLIEKLAEIHADLYGYKRIISIDDLIQFLKIEYERIGADSNITPREVIRDFIELLNIVHQNPEAKTGEILGTDNFKFANSDINEEEIHTEFAEFEL